MIFLENTLQYLFMLLKQKKSYKNVCKKKKRRHVFGHLCISQSILLLFKTHVIEDCFGYSTVLFLLVVRPIDGHRDYCITNSLHIKDTIPCKG